MIINSNYKIGKFTSPQINFNIPLIYNFIFCTLENKKNCIKYKFLFYNKSYTLIFQVQSYLGIYNLTINSIIEYHFYKEFFLFKKLYMDENINL